MAHLYNLFQNPLPEQPVFSPSSLDPRVQQHLKSLRLKEGEMVQFLNGKGQGLIARFHNLQFETLTTKQFAPLAPIELVLSPPQGDLLSQTVTQATEIGVSALYFIRSDYCQYRSKDDPPSSRGEKVSIAAMEQCGRAWSMKIAPQWSDFSQLLGQPGTNIFADENLAEQSSIGFHSQVPGELSPLPIRIYVGPEGGWSERERESFKGRAFSLGLGDLVLRVPTAVVSAVFFARIWLQSHNES